MQIIPGSIRLLAVALAGSAGLAVAGEIDLSKLPPASGKAGLTYSKDVRPLFEASCLRCHGQERPKAGLRLDSLEGVLKGSKEGKVVVPGKAEKSALVIAVARIDDETAMPPKPRAGRHGPPGGGDHPPGGPGSNGSPRKDAGPPPKPLTPEEVGLIRAWVDQGAK